MAIETSRKEITVNSFFLKPSFLGFISFAIIGYARFAECLSVPNKITLKTDKLSISGFDESKKRYSVDRRKIW